MEERQPRVSPPDPVLYVKIKDVLETMPRGERECLCRFIANYGPLATCQFCKIQALPTRSD